ncbi:MAG: hypothetical protein MJZ96_03080 [Paludibacteraceae bacterium]|nr:hypothetical protein [Paludibacteraceae bacterium]
MEPELKLYTIADLRAWLIDNNPPAGLSEQVIAPVRSFAILNNPYVREEDAVVAAIYVGDELAAFTAAFPDMYEGKRIWWATTLWCNPKYQGQGYGIIVVGSLMEAHDQELTFDRWGAHETVEIFRCLGYSTTYTPRYILGDKKINRSTLKGKLAYCVQELQKFVHHTPYTIHRTPYSLKYSNFVDGEAYAFMQARRGNDLFLREQRMLNWIMRYPFVVECDLLDKVERDTEFSSFVAKTDYKVVKVYVADAMVGVYLWHNGSVIYLYYEEEYRDVVFASIVDHVYKTQCGLITEDKALASYIKGYVYCPSYKEEKVSFSIPVDMTLPDFFTMQLGDGDSFA